MWIRLKDLLLFPKLERIDLGGVYLSGDLADLRPAKKTAWTHFFAIDSYMTGDVQELASWKAPNLQWLYMYDTYIHGQYASLCFSPCLAILNVSGISGCMI